MNKLRSYEDINKMSMKNTSMMFAPNLIRPKYAINPVIELNTMGIRIAICNFIMQNIEDIFDKQGQLIAIITEALCRGE